MTEQSAPAAPLQIKAAQQSLRPRGLWRDAWHRLVRHRLAMFGASILLVVIMMALFGQRLTPYGPNTMQFALRFAPPSFAHPFGTDDEIF